MTAGSRPITVLATGPSPGPRRRPQPRAPTNEPGLNGNRQTARSNYSTAPLSMSGPTPALTGQRPNVEPRSPSGSIPTIITAATPRSVGTHQPAAFLTSRVNTPREGRPRSGRSAAGPRVRRRGVRDEGASPGACTAGQSGPRAPARQP